MFNNIYQGKKVLLTGDSGFKGSWLALWLQKLGAEVCGVSLPMTTEPVHSELLALDMRSEICDIRNLEKLKGIFADFQPEAVFHLAAQPIVRDSYTDPAGTFSANVMGTVNVLEAIRHTPSVRSAVIISSDKCYENKELVWGYRENDPMGGYDPYSASKGCTELVVSSFRRSFFNNDDYGKTHNTLIASARAGNVIGGGDWAPCRLVPDLMRAAGAGETSEIRSPKSVRPWQHVLEPLSGYLLLGQRLFEGQKEFADGWNFGPDSRAFISVEETAAALSSCWDKVKYTLNPPAEQPHEAQLLKLDCSKAEALLKWHGVLTARETFEFTANWYRDFYEYGRVTTLAQLNEYTRKAAQRNLIWTK